MNRLVAFAIALAAAGCVFAIDTPESGDHCGFEGRATTCGRCIAELCQAAVDACCNDVRCRDALTELDRCASDAGACSALRNASTPPSRADLGFCIDKACGDACSIVSTTSKTNCRKPPFGDRLCECTVNDAPNDFECTKAAFKDTICCAPQSWPAAGNECVCRPVTCFATTEGCSCYPATTDPEREQCAGPPCCRDGEHCSCGTPCVTGQIEVPSCDVLHVGCAEGQKEVESCSLLGR